MRNIKKKMMAFAVATSTMTLLASTPTYAKESKYTVSTQKEELSDVLQNVFSKKVGQLQYKKTETKLDASNNQQEVATYESAKYRVEVVGWDANQTGDQEVTFYLTNKKASDEGIVLNNETLQANKQSTIQAADTGITVKQDTVLTVKEDTETQESEDSQQSTETQETNQSELIAQAALSQVGVGQDCTMLVTNSLAAVGINFHGWPEDYLSLGEMTDTPVPGDIIVYSGHVAIYIGDGQAVHGGWLGSQTVVSTVECTNALIGFVHIA